MSAALATLGAGFLNTAGSVYTNAMNSAAQLAINKNNAAVQYAINADQIEVARMNNETAINLANTAHQREVRDLRDANLNPILSANGNGSAVPSLDTPGLEAPQAVAPTVDNPLSGLASSLASAVQVNDAHQLNEARLAALGWHGSPDDKKELLSALSEKAMMEVNTARQELLARQDRAMAESQKAMLDNFMNRVERGMVEDVYSRDGYYKPEIRALIKEGIISDLKMRANRNFREGLNSAANVGSAVGNTVRGFLPKHWFK